MNPQPPTDAAKPRRRYAPRMAPEKRREQLIDAALNVIVEQGYEGVSIESIARTAGVTRPVIYDHFSNLGRLLQALIEREEAYALAQLEEVVPSAPRRRSTRPRCSPPACGASSTRWPAVPTPGASSCCRPRAPRPSSANTWRPTAPGCWRS